MSLRYDEIRNRITVPFEYRVLFCDHALDPSNPLLAELMVTSASGNPRARAVLFLDQGLHDRRPELITQIVAYFDAHNRTITLSARPQVVSGGEDAKRDPHVFDRCVQLLHETRLDRHSYVIAIGGGAVLDAVGFAASAVHRGLRLIRLPTTVLAQNDAGIGVKNGIDYLGTKNFLGTFQPPHAVINDFTLLRTLAPAHWRSGTAEAVKVALIRDPSFFEEIEQNSESLARAEECAMRSLIRRCAQLHLTHIATSGDPFEHGSARPLDFGHWSAHKLEQLSNFTITHGHAVAVGIAIDTLYSNRTGLLSDADAQRILRCLRRLGFALNIASQAGLTSAHDLDRLMAGIAEFQEHLGGSLCLAMLQRIGSSIEVSNLDMPVLRRCAAQVLLDEAAPQD